MDYWDLLYSSPWGNLINIAVLHLCEMGCVIGCRYRKNTQTCSTLHKNVAYHFSHVFSSW